MLKRSTVTTLLLPSLVFTTLCLLSTAIAAQKSPATVSGAPLKGVDVKLGKNPGGKAAARTMTTNKDGDVNFGNLEAGEYYVILARASQSGMVSGKPSGEEIKEAVVTIKGAKGGTKTGVWDFGKGTFHPPTQSTAKATDPDRITFTVDGTGPVICNVTIVKSKSNITNN